MAKGKSSESPGTPHTAPGVMKYQYDELIKHMILLQDHAASRTCPYSPTGETCVRKHLMTIEAYAQESIPMESNPDYKDKLERLEAEARTYRLDEESMLCGEELKSSVNLCQWARDWRKEFEHHALICEMHRSAEELEKQLAAAAAAR